MQNMIGANAKLGKATIATAIIAVITCMLIKTVKDNSAEPTPS